jgi:hypothetical protein
MPKGFNFPLHMNAAIITAFYLMAQRIQKWHNFIQVDPAVFISCDAHSRTVMGCVSRELLVR